MGAIVAPALYALVQGLRATFPRRCCPLCLIRWSHPFALHMHARKDGEEARLEYASAAPIRDWTEMAAFLCGGCEYNRQE